MPIVPGIMPVTNVAQIERFAELSGTPFPAELRRAAASAVARRPGAPCARSGSRWPPSCAQRLLLDGGAPGLHFYTLNRSTATREIYANLSV